MHDITTWFAWALVGLAISYLSNCRSEAGK